MKKLFTLVAMAFMAIGANAQAIVYEVDWTQEEAYPEGIWYADGATVSVEKGTGLIIESNPADGANYWEPQIPMIVHMGTEEAPITEGGQYVVKFTAQSSMDGELRLDFCSWDGSAATMAQVFNVTAEMKDYEVEFLDYPTECHDAWIFYQCGKLPGKHIIKKVEVWDLEAEGDDPTGIKTLKNKAQKNVRYNLAGQQVDANYKGAVIMNGKKFIQK